MSSPLFDWTLNAPRCLLGSCSPLLKHNNLVLLFLSAHSLLGFLFSIKTNRQMNVLWYSSVSVRHWWELLKGWTVGSKLPLNLLHYFWMLICKKKNWEHAGTHAKPFTPIKAMNVCLRLQGFLGCDWKQAIRKFVDHSKSFRKYKVVCEYAHECFNVLFFRYKLSCMSEEDLLQLEVPKPLSRNVILQVYISALQHHSSVLRLGPGFRKGAICLNFSKIILVWHQSLYLFC